MGQHHKLANIDPKAKLGKKVTVEAFATIEADVEIGEGTWVGPNAMVLKGTKIGNNCKIFPGAVVGGEPQDLKYEGKQCDY